MLRSVMKFFQKMSAKETFGKDAYYLTIQRRLEECIRDGSISPNDAMDEVLLDENLKADHFNRFRSHLVCQGLFEFPSPEETEANRAKYEEILAAGVKMGLLEQSDANVLRRGF